MNRNYRPGPKCLERETIKLFGYLTFGSSGAITAASSSTRGFTVAKVSAKNGRYTVTLDDYYAQFLNCLAVIEGVADTAFGANGQICNLRNVAVSSSSLTFDIQVQDAAGADAEPASGYKMYIEITLKRVSDTY